MADVLALLLKWWAAGVVLILGACLVAWGGCAMLEKLKQLLRGGVAIVAVAVVAILYGGAKNILSRFSSDAGIVVVSATMNVATNDLDATTLVYAYTGTNDVLLPVHVRQSVSNEWEELGEEWVFDGRVYDGVTNVVAWHVAASASNVVPHVMYYVGFDPPAVEIEESGGVEILSFGMTSKAVTITYAVDGSVLRGRVGTLHVETSPGDNVWLDHYTTNHVATVTNTIVGTGFFVDRTTRWRVRMEVPQ